MSNSGAYESGPPRVPMYYLDDYGDCMDTPVVRLGGGKQLDVAGGILDLTSLSARQAVHAWTNALTQEHVARSVRYLDASGLGLTEMLPAPPLTEVLDLSDNRISRIDVDKAKKWNWHCMQFIYMAGNRALPAHLAVNTNAPAQWLASAVRHFENLAVREAVVLLLLVWRRRSHPQLGHLPRDLCRLLVRLVWQTRSDEAWRGANQRMLDV